MHSIVLIIAIIFIFTSKSNAQTIIYNISSQPSCATSAVMSATNNVAWKSGLSLRFDYAKIIAFKLQWFSDAWSDSYVFGCNHLDSKYDTTTKNLRRMWSYFFDHTL